MFNINNSLNIKIMPKYELDEITPIIPTNIKSPQLIYTGTDDTGTETYKGQLQEVGVSAKRKKRLNFLQRIGKFINNEVLLNRGGVRTKNLQANPNAVDNFQIAENVGEMFNIASAGLPNRLSLTQNIGLIKDVYNGKNFMESWFGNNGVMPDEFAAEHPWLAMAGNTALDIFTPWATYKTAKALNPNNTNVQFIRNLGTVPEVDENGMFNLTKRDNAFANFTWDKSFRTHGRYKTRPGTEYLVINPKVLKSHRFLSTDPMDSFIPNTSLKASDVTFISGNPETRALAKSRGFNILTSPEIEAAYNNIDFSGGPGKLKFRIPLRSIEAQVYDNTVNELIHKTYGKPNVLDALKLWYNTGINPHIKFKPSLQYHRSTPIESNLGKRFGFDSHPTSESLPRTRIEEILDELGSKPYKVK